MHSPCGYGTHTTLSLTVPILRKEKKAVFSRPSRMGQLKAQCGASTTVWSQLGPQGSTSSICIISNGFPSPTNKLFLQHQVSYELQLPRNDVFSVNITVLSLQKAGICPKPKHLFLLSFWVHGSPLSYWTGKGGSMNRKGDSFYLLKYPPLFPTGQFLSSGTLGTLFLNTCHISVKSSMALSIGL